MADRGWRSLSPAGDPLLAIETSCDDTCAAVVTPGGEILSNVISSQARFHERYGGVVPEIASRHHLELVNASINRQGPTQAPAVRHRRGERVAVDPDA